MNRAEKNKMTARDTVFRIAGFLVIAASFVFAYLLMDFQAFRENPLAIPDDGMRLVVEPGSTLKSIADRLDRKQVLRNPVYLVMLARYLRLDARIQAGEFELQPGITPEQLLHRLAEGKVVQHTITLIEGETFSQIVQKVSADPVLVHKLEKNDAESVMAAIGYPGMNPEGRFLPETYHFPRGTSDIDYLRRAFLEMETFLQESWQQRDEDLPLKTPYDALILASIVEKETALEEERPAIAGVFVRRLRKGMRLQTDPTVIYGMGDSYKGDIRYRDLRRDTPYNTYTRHGLPPTPIAMPGKDAILAALHPAPGEALYFVARGDGSHKFSATLEQHNSAVDRYQRKR